MEVCCQPSCMCSISNPFVFVGLGFLIFGIDRFEERPWVSMYFNRNYVFKHILWLSHVLFHSTFRKETLVGIYNVIYASLKQEKLPFYMTKEAGMSYINFPVILSNAILSPQAELAHGRVCMLATLGCILRALHVFHVCVFVCFTISQTQGALISSLLVFFATSLLVKRREFYLKKHEVNITQPSESIRDENN